MSKIYFLSDDYIIALKLHSLGLHVDMLFILGYFVWNTPYSKFKLKVFWACFFNFIFLCTLFYIYAQLIMYDPDRINTYGPGNKSAAWSLGLVPGLIHEVFVPAFPIFINYYIFKKLAKYDHQYSAKVVNENIYLVLVYPSNIIGLLLSIFTPVKANSVFLYAGGFTYKFYVDTLKLHVRKYPKEQIEGEKYFLIDTGIGYQSKQKELWDLSEADWTIQDNCMVLVFQSIIGPYRKYLR